MNGTRLILRTTIRSHTKIQPYQLSSCVMVSLMNGDLNNTAAIRAQADFTVDPTYRHTSLAIPASQDESLLRTKYRPFLVGSTEHDQDWVAQLELSTVLKMVDLQVLKPGNDRLRILVLYGSMRNR